MANRQSPGPKTVEDVITSRLSTSPFHPLKAPEGVEWKRKSPVDALIKLDKSRRMTNREADHEITEVLAKLNDDVDNSLMRSTDGDILHRHSPLNKSPFAKSPDPRGYGNSLSHSIISKVQSHDASPTKVHSLKQGGGSSFRRSNTLKDYSDQQEIAFYWEQFKSLKSQCAELSIRLKQVEKMTGQLKDKQVYELGLPRRIQRSFNAVQHKLYNLGRTFMSGQDKIRDHAATQISRCIRGWLARKKYQRAIMALRSWKTKETATLRMYVANWATSHDLKLKRAKQARENHFQRLLGIILREWHACCRNSFNTNLQLQKKEELMQIRRWNNIMRKLLVAWRMCATGPHSRKKITQGYNDRYAEAYKRVAYRDMSTEPEPKEVHKEFRRLSIAIFQQGKVRRLFSFWRSQIQNADDSQRILTEKALNHYMNSLVSRSFRKWTNWVKRIKLGVTGTNKIKPAESRISEMALSRTQEDLADAVEDQSDERWTKRRNKMAEVYRKHWEIQQKYFRAWRHRVQIKVEVERRLKVKEMAMKACVFSELRSLSRYQRKVKLQVLQQWVSVSLSRLETAFKSWYVWYARRRAEKNSNKHLVEAFIRRRKQRMISSCFKNWRWAVYMSMTEPSWLYDDVPEVTKRYEDQVSMNAQLKKNIGNYRNLLDNFEHTLKTQEELYKKKEVMITEKDNELLSAKMALHNAQMEVQRLNTIMEKSLTRYVVPLKSVNLVEAPSPMPAQQTFINAEPILLERTPSIPRERLSTTNVADLATSAPAESRASGGETPITSLGSKYRRKSLENEGKAGNTNSLWKDEFSSCKDRSEFGPLTDPKPKQTTNSLEIMTKMVQLSPIKKQNKLPPTSPTYFTGELTNHSLLEIFSKAIPSLDTRPGSPQLSETAPKIDSASPTPNVTAEVTSDIIVPPLVFSESGPLPSLATTTSNITSSKTSLGLDITDLVASQKNARTPSMTSSPSPFQPISRNQSVAPSPFQGSTHHMSMTPTLGMRSSARTPTNRRNSLSSSLSEHTGTQGVRVDDMLTIRPVESMDLFERARFVQQTLEFTQLDPKSPTPLSVSLLSFLRTGAVNHDIKDAEKKIKQQNQTQELMKRLHRTSQTITWGNILGFVDQATLKKVTHL